MEDDWKVIKLESKQYDGIKKLTFMARFKLFYISAKVRSNLTRIGMPNYLLFLFARTKININPITVLLNLLALFKNENYDILPFVYLY